jgi:hypothetical protein
MGIKKATNDHSDLIVAGYLLVHKIVVACILILGHYFGSEDQDLGRSACSIVAFVVLLDGIRGVRILLSGVESESESERVIRPDREEKDGDIEEAEGVARLGSEEEREDRDKEERDDSADSRACCTCVWRGLVTLGLDCDSLDVLVGWSGDKSSPNSEGDDTVVLGESSALRCFGLGSVRL